jgi:hypothetical protein
MYREHLLHCSCSCSCQWGETTSLNCGHQPAQVLNEYGQRRWNNIDNRKLKTSKKNLSQCHYGHHKFHMEQPGQKPVHPQ